MAQRNYIITMSWNRLLDGAGCEDLAACTTLENAKKAAQKRIERWDGKMSNLSITITERNSKELLWEWQTKH